jgi:hypothetical protein
MSPSLNGCFPPGTGTLDSDVNGIRLRISKHEVQDLSPVDVDPLAPAPATEKEAERF